MSWRSILPPTCFCPPSRGVVLVRFIVSAGAAVADGVRHATSLFTWFSTLAQRAPNFSGGLINLVGFYVSAHGAAALMRA